MEVFVNGRVLCDAGFVTGRAVLIEGERIVAVVADAIAAVRDAMAAKVPGILGIHIEGPFLNELRRGAHDAQKFRTLDTDAMPTVGTQDTSFQLQGREIFVRDGKCVDREGTLSGSALDMASAVRNTVGMLGVELAEAVRMASTYPAAFLGLDTEIGRIAPGFRANLVLADAQLNIIATWIDGAGTYDQHTIADRPTRKAA